MKGTAKSKVVTSGRLTGGVKGQLARRRVSPKPGPAACPEPAYSLYSTDSEDQVTSLHKGLDRCAALLSGILQAEKTGLPKAVKGGAAKSRPSTSRIKKTIKSTDQKSCQSGSTTPRTSHQSAVPAAHSQVKLHPPQKHPPTLLQSRVPSSPSPKLQHLPATNPPPEPQTSISSPQPSVHPPQPNPHSGQLPLPQNDCQAASEAPRTRCKAECDREEEIVPVRDLSAQSTAADPHAAVRHTHSHINACALKMSNMQLELGKVDKVPQDAHSGEDCSAEKEVKLKTVQYLLAELKALISGQGSVAERLLSHLEHTVSSPLMIADGSNIPTAPDLSPLHSQNAKLRRRVRILNQQLKEKAERQQNMDTLCNSEVLTLQEDLATAQSRLQDLQDDLAELRKALQDSQRQLTDREADNTVLKTDLEATRSRLLDSEREKRELESLAQQRLEEIGNLKRILQYQDWLNCPSSVDSSVLDTVPTKQHFNQYQHRQDPAEPPTDRIIQFLMSLGQPEPTHAEHVRAAAEREGNSALEQKKLSSVQPRDALSHPDVRSQRGDKPKDSAHHQNSHVDRSHRSDEGQSHGLNSTLSQCDVESAWSDRSTRSRSTFDTRDETAFRDGLAALDASLASLQKTIQLDLGK
ncbi:uncharacterized protein ccdc14 [Sander vitreus]